MTLTSFWGLFGWAYVAFMISAVVAYSVHLAERRFGILGVSVAAVFYVMLLSFVHGALF